MNKKINSALISVYHKTGLDEIINRLNILGIDIYSTGGTQKYIESKGVKVHSVESLTSYPSILGGRVKTLHPKVFGGILAMREEDHQAQLSNYEIPELDLVIVDLYPFEETVASTDNEAEIIEKIDIGGISLIRAAAKNYKDVTVVPSKNEYPELLEILNEYEGYTTIEQRKLFAKKAFAISSNYDTAIYQFFNGGDEGPLRVSIDENQTLRYGENPHQTGTFYGNLNDKFDKLGGKALSYNNLVDIDAAVEIMSEFENGDPCFAILKHTNPCGVAVRSTVSDAWDAALAGDPVSAFGGILISNATIDLATAEKINTIFYEVLIAPGFDADAEVLLTKKKKRILLKIKDYNVPTKRIKTILNGIISQDNDLKSDTAENFEMVTDHKPTQSDLDNLAFASKCVKHLKSNTIVIAKDNQLLGMGCGQTSRVDACKQAIDKAGRMGFDITGAAMASDAFFPFPDCVEIAYNAGIRSVVQPGGSIKDQLSIDYCNANNLPMVFTGTRHFKH